MLRLLRQVSVRVRLGSLIVLFIVGFVSYSLISYSQLSKVKVNGPIYAQIVQGKDVIADILPPPQYIIESYLNVLELLKETDQKEVAKLVEYGKKLKQDYDDRHAYWIKDLSEGKMKTVLLEDSYLPAKEFYEIRDQKFIPAILRNDRAAAEKIVQELLKPKYVSHRAKIDEVVGMANDLSKANEEHATAEIASKNVLLLVIGLAVIGISSLISMLIAGSIVNPLRAIHAIMSKVSEGDYTLQLDAGGHDEISRVASATNVAVATTAKAIEEVKNAAEREKQLQARRAEEERRQAEEKRNSEREAAEQERQRLEAQRKQKDDEAAKEHARNEAEHRAGELLRQKNASSAGDRQRRR